MVINGKSVFICFNVKAGDDFAISEANRTQEII